MRFFSQARLQGLEAVERILNLRIANQKCRIFDYLNVYHKQWNNWCFVKEIIWNASIYRIDGSPECMFMQKPSQVKVIRRNVNSRFSYLLPSFETKTSIIGCFQWSPQSIYIQNNLVLAILNIHQLIIAVLTSNLVPKYVENVSFLGYLDWYCNLVSFYS